MSSKKGNRKAAASAAAHAASKRKNSAIEISADNESRVRDALKVGRRLAVATHMTALSIIIQHVESSACSKQTCRQHPSASPIHLFLAVLDTLPAT